MAEGIRLFLLEPGRLTNWQSLVEVQELNTAFFSIKIKKPVVPAEKGGPVIIRHNVL